MLPGDGLLRMFVCMFVGLMVIVTLWIEMIRLVMVVRSKVWMASITIIKYRYLLVGWIYFICITCLIAILI